MELTEAPPPDRRRINKSADGKRSVIEIRRLV